MYLASLLDIIRYDPHSLPWQIDLPLRAGCAIQIGMMSEQSLEREHKGFNKLDGIYVTMRPEAARLRSTMQQRALQSEPAVPEFRRPRRIFRGRRASAPRHHHAIEHNQNGTAPRFRSGAVFSSHCVSAGNN
jgi:hypothetical protein